MTATITWLIAIATLNFASFAWGLRYHFNRGTALPPAMAALSVLSVAFFFLFVAMAPNTPVGGAALVAASILFATALILFWWAIATTRLHRPNVAHQFGPPSFIYQNGPYALVRHPFYLAYILFWFGTAAATGSWQWAAALILTGWYGVLAFREEKELMQSDIAPRYAKYRQKSLMKMHRRRKS